MTDQAPAFCPSCGAPLPADAVKFCPSCGNPITPAAPQPEPWSASQEAAARSQAAPDGYPQHPQGMGDQQQPRQQFQPQQPQQPYQAPQSQQQPQQQPYQGQQPQPPYQQPYQGQQPQQPQQPPFQSAPPNSKSKVAAGLLAIFLGSFGIHKFYLGYTAQGVIMLVISLLGFFLAGVPTIIIEIIAFIEGIIYLTKSDQDFYNIYCVHKKKWF